MVDRKTQISLLENLHRSSKNYSKETKEKIENLLQMIEVVIKSLEKQHHETKIQKIKRRIKKVID
jgi:polyhydroxyalkanoate synthesis regulator phasin